MLCMLHRHVGLSRPFYVNKIYSYGIGSPPGMGGGGSKAVLIGKFGQ